MAVISRGGRGARAVSLVALAATTLVASGCWPQQGGTSENQNADLIETVLTPATVGGLTQRWTAPGMLDAVVGNQILGADASGPDQVGPGAFSRVRSIATGTGAEQWQLPVTNDAFVMAAIGNGATVQGDRVMVGIYGAVVSGSLTVCGDTTYGLPLDGRGQSTSLSLFGLWSPNVPFGSRLAVENTFFTGPSENAPQSCGFGSPTLQIYGPGSPTPSNLAWSAPGGGRPVIIDDQLLVASGSTVRSFVASGCGATTCDPVWSADLGVPVADMAADAGGRLYVLTDAGAGGREVLAVDRADGSVTWRAALPGSTTGPASMAVEGGRLHVAAGSTLSTFAGGGCGAATCDPDWTAALTAPFAGNLATGGGVVYAADAGGAVGAWDATGCGAAACDPLTTLTVNGTPTRLVQASASLFVETDDPASTLQTITAFALPS